MEALAAEFADATEGFSVDELMEVRALAAQLFQRERMSRDRQALLRTLRGIADQLRAV